jgi:hypothetical protein
VIAVQSKRPLVVGGRWWCGYDVSRNPLLTLPALVCLNASPNPLHTCSHAAATQDMCKLASQAGWCCRRLHCFAPYFTYFARLRFAVFGRCLVSMNCPVCMRRSKHGSTSNTCQNGRSAPKPIHLSTDFFLQFSHFNAVGFS